jgi:restriction system protein
MGHMALRDGLQARREIRVLVKRITPLVAEVEAEVEAVREKVATGAIDPPSNMPRCPRCKSWMVMRTARQGRYEGERFWGCSRYPYCEGIRNLVGERAR